MNKRVTYDVISYGEWTRPRMKNFREQCCDCGLIHRLDFRIVDGKVEFRTRRDDRAPAAAPRRFRFAPDELVFASALDAFPTRGTGEVTKRSEADEFSR
jgi:hypothetical protein